MKPNPYIHALGATAYIWLIGFVFHYIRAIRSNTPDKFTDPILMLSLLVFSAAVMAFLFFYQPVLLLIEHKRREALFFFFKTLALFGCLTLIGVISVL